MNTAQALLERHKKAREAKKGYLTDKLASLQESIKHKKPFALSYEPFAQTKEKYSQLLNKRVHINEELNRYHDTANESFLDQIGIFTSLLVISFWFILFILYRTLMGSEYFLETIPEFIIDIFGEKYALIAIMAGEAILALAFEFIASQMAKSNLTYKRYFFFRKLFYISLTLFLSAIIAYIYLSSIY